MAARRFSALQGCLVAGAMALACISPATHAADLIEALQAAERADMDHAVARAAHEAALPRRDQAAALWRPRVEATASTGFGTHETQTRGAQFSTPAFGVSNNVNFNTSIRGGTAGRWAITASQPLYNPGRRAQQRLLGLSVDRSDLEWQSARQSLMLRVAQRYFDLALAEESLRVLKLQLDAVQRASTEAKDRFTLGSTPVTDTYETGARLAGVRAQVLAAESDVQLKRNLLADSTGLPAATLSTRLPAGRSADARPRPLEAWLADAQSGNPDVRIQELAAEVAKQEASRFSFQSSVAVDVIAQASRERLSGSGDFGSASNRGTDRMIGVQVSVPLFTGGYRSAQQEEALRLADKAATEADRSRQVTAQQVRSAWLGLSVGAERVHALADGVKASEARRDATHLGHQVGERTTLDLLNAENDTAAARLALVQARAGLLMDRLRLAALVGQLDDDAWRSVNEDLEPVSSPRQ
ncbi:TolC family protein [Variovorax sp. RA8]|uniref:TolC family protein n=1 Tax=Variovorax sp. (strain JCM 16519 / RA8) TaxID=662548 RepID=UPI001E2F237F|nr:TolC family protein [Variovorax sp. RA8]